jgi:hypothetical protein
MKYAPIPYIVCYRESHPLCNCYTPARAFVDAPRLPRCPSPTTPRTNGDVRFTVSAFPETSALSEHAQSASSRPHASGVPRARQDSARRPCSAPGMRFWAGQSSSSVGSVVRGRGRVTNRSSRQSAWGFGRCSVVNDSVVFGEVAAAVCGLAQPLNVKRNHGSIKLGTYRIDESWSSSC